MPFAIFACPGVRIGVSALCCLGTVVACAGPAVSDKRPANPHETPDKPKPSASVTTKPASCAVLGLSEREVNALRELVKSVLGQAKTLAGFISDTKKAEAGVLTVNLRGREVTVDPARSDAEREYVALLAGSAPQVEELKTGLRDLLQDANRCNHDAVERAKTAGWYTLNTVKPGEEEEFRSSPRALEVKAELERRLGSISLSIEGLLRGDRVAREKVRESFAKGDVGKQMDTEEDFRSVENAANSLAQALEFSRRLRADPSPPAGKGEALQGIDAKLPMMKLAFCAEKTSYVSEHGGDRFQDAAKLHCESHPPEFAYREATVDMSAACGEAYRTSCTDAALAAYQREAQARASAAPAGSRAAGSRCRADQGWCGTGNIGTCCESSQVCCQRRGGNPFCGSGTNPCGR